MDADKDLIHSGEGLVRFIYLLLITIAIILGNFLVIVAVGKFKKLRRSTNIMLASLAVADLMVGILTVPLYIAWTMHPGIFDHSPFLCHAVLLSCLLVVATSQINLLFLSIERYLAVCAPFKHRNIMICCPWLHRTIVCLTWIVSLTSTGLASLAMKSDYEMCNYYNVFDKWFLFFAVIFGIFIPFIAIIFMNLRVFLIVRQHELRRIYFGFEYSDSTRHSSEQEMCQPLSRRHRQSEGDSRHSKQEKWTTFCILLCRNQCSDKEAIESDESDVFIDEQNDAGTKTYQHKVSPFIKPHYRVTDVDDYIRNTTCDDIVSSCPPFQEIIKNSANQDHGYGNKSPYKRRNEIIKQKYDSILESSYTSGSKRTVAVRGNLKASNVEVASFDKRTGKRFQSESSIRTIKHDYETQSNFHSEKDLSSSEQMSLIEPSLNVAYFKQKESHLPFHRNIYKVTDIKSKPKIIKKMFEHKTKDAPNKGSEYSLSQMTSSLPHVNIQSTRDDFLCESYYSKVHPKDTNERKKCKQRSHIDTGIELVFQNDLNSLLPPQRLNIQESLSLQNFDVISLDSKPFTQRSNIQNNKALAKSCVLNDFQEYTVQMDYDRPADLEKPVLSVDKSNVNVILQPKSYLGQCSNPLTLSPKILTRIASDAAFLDKIYEYSTSLTVAHQHPPHFLSTHSISDRSLERTCHCPPLKRRSSAPAFFQPVAEVKSEQCIVTKQWKPRRQSKPPQRPKEKRESHLETIRLSNRTMRSDTLSSRKASSCDRGIQKAYISKKVARTVALVCASFILAWLPFFTVIIVNTFCTQCNLDYFLNAVLMVAFAQSAINPIIYALCHASFRNAYKSLFSQICTRSEMT